MYSEFPYHFPIKCHHPQPCRSIFRKRIASQDLGQLSGDLYYCISIQYIQAWIGLHQQIQHQDVKPPHRTPPKCRRSRHAVYWDLWADRNRKPGCWTSVRYTKKGTSITPRWCFCETRLNTGIIVTSFWRRKLADLGLQPFTRIFRSDSPYQDHIRWHNHFHKGQYQILEGKENPLSMAMEIHSTTHSSKSWLRHNSMAQALGKVFIHQAFFHQAFFREALFHEAFFQLQMSCSHPGLRTRQAYRDHRLI